MRRRPRTDANHAEIVAALRALGCSVVSTAGVGDGFPDLAVGYRGETYLVEVKDGSKPPSARLLTADEASFFASWRGAAVVIESVDEAQAFIRSRGVRA